MTSTTFLRSPERRPLAPHFFLRKKPLVLRSILVLLVVLLLCAVPLFSQVTPADDVVRAYPPKVSSGRFLGKIKPLRDLAPASAASRPEKSKRLYEKANYFFANERNSPAALPRGGDPLAQTSAARGSTTSIEPLLNFDGIGETNATPPDPTGDVGKNHYVQMVNDSDGALLRVWDKKGNPVTVEISTPTIWQQVGVSASRGDPIIQYDPGAERWLMLELRGTSSNSLLFAVSDDSDPTGSWMAYELPTFGFPDYPKLYVWNDSYIISVNEIASGNLCSGYALERDALLAGKADFKVYRFEMPNYAGINFQPATGADWEAGPAPAPGSPALMFRVYDDAWNDGQDQLQWWEIYADWADPSKSRIEGPYQLFPAPFETTVCYGGSLFDCIEQPGFPNTQRITAIENIIMYRAPWRDFGTHQSLVLNHIADVTANGGDGGDAQVRWYELRRSPGDPLWKIHQQGTYAPDPLTNRFMGTLSMDAAGNIGFGYSVCSEEVFPGLRIAARRASDAPGTLSSEEYSLVEGTASHGTFRWGDYSSMAVDPVDGRTFWFTGEYQPEGVGWATRIGSFRIGEDSFDLSPQRLLAPVEAVDLDEEEVTVELLNKGVSAAEGAASVSLFFEGNLVVTDALATPLAAGGTLSHTFSKTVNMGQVGKTYALAVVVNWEKDERPRNDTLRASVRKLTSHDAAILGQISLPDVLCDTANVTVGLVLGNASGLPMQSARVRWRLNNQFFNTLDWTGNLAPGASDTLWLPLLNVLAATNKLQVEVDQPNGQLDQDGSNNNLEISFFGNPDGSFITLRNLPVQGTLAWELTDDLFGGIYASGTMTDEGPADLSICTDDNTCYKFVLRSLTPTWTGNFRVLDFTGKTLLETGELNPNPVTFSFCTPQRKSRDVGAWSLLSPLSGPSLTAAEQVTVEVRNFGLQPITDNIQVAYRMDGGPWTEETMTTDIPPGKTLPHTFAAKADLSGFDKTYGFDVRATVMGDEDPANDQTTALVRHKSLNGAVLESVDVGYVCNNANTITATVRVKNNGLQIIRNVYLNYTVNGVAQPGKLLTTGIPPEAVLNLSLPIKGSVDGLNELVVRVDSINGVSANSTGSTSYNLSLASDLFTFRFTTDDRPEELTWELLNERGDQVLYSGGPYTEPFKMHEALLCLPYDSCFVLKIKDSGGNANKGGFQLYRGFVLIWEKETLPTGGEHPVAFCDRQSCTRLVALFRVNPDKANTPAPDGSIIITTTGGTSPYSYSLDNGPIKFTGIFTSVAAGTHSVQVRDAGICSLTYRFDLKKVSSTPDPTAPAPALGRQLSASPNPTSGMLMLKLPALPGERDMDCEVISPQGQVLQTLRMSRWDDTLSTPVALDSYPSGTYLLRAFNHEGNWSVQVVKKG